MNEAVFWIVLLSFCVVDLNLHLWMKLQTLSMVKIYRKSPQVHADLKLCTMKMKTENNEIHTFFANSE